MSWSFNLNSEDEVRYLPLWIVKCRECTYRRKTWNGKKPTFKADFFCSYTGGHEVVPNDFCSHGMREGEE